MSLPLAAKVAIRDNWDKADSPLQKSLATLREILGYEITVNPEWQQLFSELASLYPTDKARPVAIVTGCVEVWARALKALLEDSANEEWTDELLEKLKPHSPERLWLYIDVSQDASTYWDANRGGYAITVPKRPITSATEFFSVFSGQLLSSTGDDTSSSQTIPLRSSLAAAAAPSAEEWADVSVDRSGNPSIVEPRPAGTRIVEFIPDPNSLPRPDDLLLRPPYYLSVHFRSRNEIEVLSSHSPSLRFLAEYLRKWTRANHQITNSPPSVELTLKESAFGLGQMYDTLQIHADNRYGGGHFLSPHIILHIVESTLGYQQVYADQQAWTYKKNEPFRSM